MIYTSNLARDVAELERERDKLLMALEAMVNVTSGNFKERVNAINILFEVKNETITFASGKKQDDDIRGAVERDRGAAGID